MKDRCGKILNQESTKDRYLFEALKLFGERGFASVRTADPAKAVGCVPSALYKHYKSKQEPYNAILAKSIRGFDSGMERIQVDFSKHPEQREKYLSILLRELNSRLNIEAADIFIVINEPTDENFGFAGKIRYTS